jgi:pimeloyl-ACP methyl ester carboxylesterase
MVGPQAEINPGSRTALGAAPRHHLRFSRYRPFDRRYSFGDRSDEGPHRVLPSAGPEQFRYRRISLGGIIAQELASECPDMARRIILLGTGPRGGEDMALDLSDR